MEKVPSQMHWTLMPDLGAMLAIIHDWYRMDVPKAVVCLVSACSMSMTSV